MEFFAAQHVEITKESKVRFAIDNVSGEELERQKLLTLQDLYKDLYIWVLK